MGHGLLLFPQKVEILGKQLPSLGDCTHWSWDLDCFVTSLFSYKRHHLQHSVNVDITLML